jgi:tRNA nucleotidyltransferase (CCA-adding enzyme)
VLRQQNTPCKLRDLKINGKDVAMMGVSGKRIGQLLEQILRLVVDDPSLNDRETLLALAAQTVKKIGGHQWKSLID